MRERESARERDRERERRREREREREKERETELDTYRPSTSETETATERGTAREDTGDRERTYMRAIDSERYRVRLQERVIDRAIKKERANERERAKHTHTHTHTHTLKHTLTWDVCMCVRDSEAPPSACSDSPFQVRLPIAVAQTGFSSAARREFPSMVQRERQTKSYTANARTLSAICQDSGKSCQVFCPQIFG